MKECMRKVIAWILRCKNCCSLISPLAGLRLGPNPKNLSPRAPFECLTKNTGFISVKISKNFEKNVIT